MLLVFLLMFAAIGAFENENCDIIIKLKRREMLSLQSPNHPLKVTPWSSCRWTIIAELERRVIFVCPFYHKKTPEDGRCHGHFTVLPDGAEESRHCQDSGFHRIGVNHRMVITYENKLNETVDDFTCYVYAELNSRWNLIENYKATEDFKQKITLYENDMAQLASPNYPDDETRTTNMQWNVVAPSGSRIILNCPFTNKPPDPLTIQFAPCHGKYTVVTEGGTETHDCREKTFSVSSSTDWMVFTYENLLGTPDDDFVCYVYSEGKSPKPETGVLPYENCDHVINLSSGEVGKWESPNYPDDSLPHSTCRYTVVSSKDSQIGIHCTEPQLAEDEACFAHFTIATAGKSTTTDCLDDTYSRITRHNWTIMTYENPSDDPVRRFKCWLQEVGDVAVKECTNCTVTEEFVNEDCDTVIPLYHREIRKLTSPNFPENEPGRSTCRYTMIAPPECRIVLACLVAVPSVTNNTEVMPCDSQLTVLAEGRNKTLHCSERTFSSASINNRMVLKYENILNQSIPSFSCDLYAEEKLPWDEQKNLSLHGVLPYDQCDHEIQLPMNGMIKLKSPNHPNNEPGSSACRWNVVAPSDSRVLLSCPFPENQDVTPSTQEKPCTAHFTVTTEGRPTSTYCRDKPFLRSSINNKMAITYENLSPTPTESFECYLYAELKSPWNECENCSVTDVVPYSKCDLLFNLSYNEMRDLKLPESDTPRSSCRWTVVAPEDTRVFLSCPFNNVIVGGQCSSYFTVTTAGNETRYCREHNIIHFSISNWMTVTYDNPSFDTFSPFKCYAYVEKKLSSKKCGPGCFALDVLDYSKCEYNIQLNQTGKGEALASPDYPTEIRSGVPCRWTVLSPGLTSIYMNCRDLSDDDVKDDDICRGYFAIYTAGRYEGPTIHCRYGAFATSSTDNELIVTYGNQLGVSTKPFKCFVYAVDTTCRHSIQSLRLPYNDFYRLSVSYWESTVPPWPSCSWSIESQNNTQIYLICNYFRKKLKGSVMVSTTGDDQLTDGLVWPLDTYFTQVSVENKMFIEYNITEDTKPNKSIGCAIFVDRADQLKECNCGNKFDKTRPYGVSFDNYESSDHRRIMNGKETVPNEYPMMAALIFKHGRSMFCGATIISDRYALTAAQCLITAIKPLIELALLIGVHDRTQAENSTLLDINFWKVHKSYEQRIHDIAIVGVSTPMHFSKIIRPVCLPFYNRKQSFFGRKVTLLGWGNTQLSDSVFDFFKVLSSDVLMKIDGVIDSHSNCTIYHLNKMHLCIRVGDKGACHRDTGGPVLWKDPKTGLQKLVGIITGGQCVGPHNRATDVIQYLDWLEQILPSVKFCKVE